MQILLTLNDLYKNYAAGLLDKKDFEGSIYKTIRENGHRFGIVGWNREDSDDYVSSLYRRISRAIDAYKDTGASFETYIGSLVRLTIKEYRIRQSRGYCEETAAWLAHIGDSFTNESEPEYIADALDSGVSDANESGDVTRARKSAKLSNPRQLLILLLKCSSFISAEFMEKISPSLGYEPEVLGEMINHLKRQREKREAVSESLREKINYQFHRCILYEKKLRAMPQENVVAWRLRNNLNKARVRLDKTRDRLASMRLDPSNAQIAKLLGISKGTVDCVLYNLKAQGVARGQLDPQINRIYTEN